MTTSNDKKSVLNIYNDINKIQNGYFDYLKSLASSNQNDDDKKLLRKVRTVILNFFHIKAFDYMEQEMDLNYVRMCINILETCYKYYVKIYDEEKSEVKNSELYNGLLDIIGEIVPDTIYILNCISFDSIKFCTKFIENEGLKILFEYINNPVLLNSYVKYSKSKESKKFKNIDGTLRRLMGSLVCLARVYANHKNSWKECNAASVFLNYSKTTKDIIDNKIYGCMAVAFVADDDDIEALPELKDVIPDLAKLVGTSAKIIQETENLVRNKMELDDAENEIVEVYCVYNLDTQWSLINLLKALYHLAVHDKLKYEIYYKNHLSKYLKSLIFNGNSIEREYALNLLWQLCFDKQIAQDVKEDNIIYEFIENLSNDNTHKNVQKNASGIIWLLNKKLNTDSPNVKQPSNEDAKMTIPAATNLADANKSKHIMISYNRDSRDLCLKIKSDLEKQNFKVWIDVEDISGSSLESMANAIENSMCVLMCMTEKYKQSTNCRAEAEYTFQLNKPIIPLIMQKDYKPGIILGSKIFVNFTRYEYSECIRRLNVEIQGVLNFGKLQNAANELKLNPVISSDKDENAMYKIVVDNLINKDKDSKPNQVVNQQQTLNKNDIIQKVPANIISQNKNIKIFKWTESDVEKWLQEKKIHPNIELHLKPCDGQLLYEFYLIKKESPDFFYRSLAINKSNCMPVMIRDVAVFSLELKKIVSLT